MFDGATISCQFFFSFVWVWFFLWRREGQAVGVYGSGRGGVRRAAAEGWRPVGEAERLNLLMAVRWAGLDRVAFPALK